jgi:general L-amino acid transport system permease protein
MRQWLRKNSGLLWQAGVVIGFGLLLFLIVTNTITNIKRAGLASGFDFLGSTAGFDVGFHIIDYDETDTYGRAFWVGVTNTLLVSSLGIIFASLIGFMVGMARTAHNWMLSRLAGAYVEVVRNIPLLLQLFFWYFAVLRNLPSPQESIAFKDAVFINIRGLYFPRLVDLWQWKWELPVLDGFNFSGGIHVVPELSALVVALSVYTAAFIAEVVRGGLLAVSKGQHEAAEALGLNRLQILRYITLPQAMRVIIPPLANQYLNLTKNSTLAAAIAFPDLVHVFAGTALLQTGQAVEIMCLTMGFYLAASLTIAVIMNLFNKRFMRYGLTR